MIEGILDFYNDELRLLRKEGGAFAARHPEVAARMQVDRDGVVADPHVERLIEAFAYLTARIRRKLDDEFPEITQALLGVLYPHLLAPIPSASVVQFSLTSDQTESHVVPRGSIINADPVEGTACTFRTTTDAVLWPIRVESASFGPIEEVLPGYAVPLEAKSRLKIRLRATSKDAPFSVLATSAKGALTELRFFLHGANDANLLYEYFMNYVHPGGVVAYPVGGKSVAVLPERAIAAVGYDREEAMLPHDGRTFPGYRLLMEYFAFPEKFSFIDVKGFTAHNMREAGDCVDLLIFFDRPCMQLERGVSDRTLRLGCTPMVNLFTKTAEFDLTHRTLEHRVVVDVRQERATEVYSIDRVELVRPGKRPIICAPLYGLSHGASLRESPVYWHAKRRANSEIDGTEVYLSIISGLNSEADVGEFFSSGGVVRTHTTCLNRDWVSKLRLGAGGTRLHMERSGPVSKVESLIAPTPTLRPHMREENLWRLISHLSLNHLSITNNEKGAAWLREMLTLYDFDSSGRSRSRIDAIRSVRSSHSTYRVEGGAFCRGIHIELTLDERRFADNGAFLFTSVLERFLALSCTINSAVKLTVKAGEQTWNSWCPRAGERMLL